MVRCERRSVSAIVAHPGKELPAEPGSAGVKSISSLFPELVVEAGPSTFAAPPSGLKPPDLTHSFSCVCSATRTSRNLSVVKESVVLKNTATFA